MSIEKIKYHEELIKIHGYKEAMRIINKEKFKVIMSRYEALRKYSDKTQAKLYSELNDLKVELFRKGK